MEALEKQFNALRREFDELRDDLARRRRLNRATALLASAAVLTALMSGGVFAGLQEGGDAVQLTSQKSTPGEAVRLRVTNTTGPASDIAGVYVERSRLRLGAGGAAGFLNVAGDVPASPLAGDLRYDGGSGSLLYFDGSAWRAVSTGGGGIPGSFVAFTPESAQLDASPNASLFINDTGGGNLLQLQSAGSNRFAVGPNGFLGIGTAAPSGLVDIVNQAPGTEMHLRLRVSTTDNTDPYGLGMATNDFEKFVISTEDGGNRQALAFGDGTAGGNHTIFGVASSTDSGTTWKPRLAIKQSGNIGIGTHDQFGGAQGVLGLSNAAVLPSANPVGGHVVFVENGALKGRGPSGTVTTIAPADPHCPRCDRDFALEWENDRYGTLSICAWCLTEALERLGIDAVIRKSAPKVR
jgi:hypothetical protein